jgi:hypothetical protein
LDVQNGMVGGDIRSRNERKLDAWENCIKEAIYNLFSLTNIIRVIKPRIGARYENVRNGCEMCTEFYSENWTDLLEDIGLDGRIILKRVLKIQYECGIHSCGTGLGSLNESWDYGNETLGFVKTREIYNELSDYQIPNESIPCG